MHKFCGLLLFVMHAAIVSAQTVSTKITTAFTAFEKDALHKNASISLYVIDAPTGKVVFDKNSQLGLAPASTQKIITSITAYELLGQSYLFNTGLGYTGTIKDGVLKGDLIVTGTGDPTFGSFRWNSTKPDLVLKEWVAKVKSAGIKKIEGSVKVNTNAFTYQGIPDGWIWQDIGNYYGAGSYAINWKENQVDLSLTSGNEIGDAVLVKKDNQPATYYNELKAAGKGTGDNAYVYLDGSISGTIPVSEKDFTISVASLNPLGDFLQSFSTALTEQGVTGLSSTQDFSKENIFNSDANKVPFKNLQTTSSPQLDSVIYWFNKKSINLYGEALIKAIALHNEKSAATDEGLKLLKDFWKQKGIETGELNMKDGSGLSPLNRVTTHAQVELLKYAKTKDWFAGFYQSLPEFNGMKMKSGTISGVKGFCGYHKAKDGKEYIYSFLVNNYQGSASGLVQKMYKVLNELK